MNILLLTIGFAAIFMVAMTYTGYIKDYTFTYVCENGSTETYTREELSEIEHVCIDEDALMPDNTFGINFSIYVN
jgi:hypothetical protein